MVVRSQLLQPHKRIHKEDPHKTGGSYAYYSIHAGFNSDDLIDSQSEDVNKKLLKDCINQSENKTLDEAEAASYILKELWNRLQETHRLRVVK